MHTPACERNRLHTDGIRPYGIWFEEAAKLATLRTFSRDDVPRVLNGASVTHPAHVSDFYRLDVRPA